MNRQRDTHILPHKGQYREYFLCFGGFLKQLAESVLQVISGIDVQKNATMDKLVKELDAVALLGGSGCLLGNYNYNYNCTCSCTYDHIRGLGGLEGA